MAAEPNNLALWERVCKTDPAITKQVKYGKREFTTACAQARIKNATREWGSYGNAWGVKDCQYGYVANAAGETVEVWLEALFYSPAGTFPISADMAFHPGNDSRKKLLTDLTTKAMAKQGFNADLFEGRFDDDKYVDEMRQEFGSEAPPAAPQSQEANQLNGWPANAGEVF